MSKEIKLYNTIPIHTYKNNINININYSYIVAFSTFYQSYTKFYNIIKNTKLKTYNNNCVDMLFKDKINSLDSSLIENINKMINTEEFTPFRRFFYINYIINDIGNINDSNNLLLIANTFLIHQFINLNIKIDYIAIDNEDMDKEKYDSFLKSVSNKINKIEFISLYKKEDNITYEQQYNNIVIKINEFMFPLYVQLYGLTKIPYLIFTILKSLKYLKNNGNLFIMFIFSYINDSFEFIIKLLSYLFDDIKIISEKNNIVNDSDFNMMIHCKNFKKHNLNNNIIKIINNILNDKSILKYNYNLCEFLNYYSAITHKNAHHFNNNFNIYPVDKDFNVKFKPLYVIDNINIDLNYIIDKEALIKSEYIIYKLKNIYNSLIDKYNYIYLKHFNYKNNKINIDKKIINTMYYNILSNSIEYFEKYKIPYNKAYLIYIDKFNKNLISDMFIYKKALKYNILLNNNINSLSINNINLNVNQPYNYDIFEKNQELLKMALQIKLNLIQSINEAKIKKKPLNIIENIENGFTKSIPLHINQNLKLKYKVDNIFCEIFEIYNTYNIFPLKNNNVSILLLNELSGQSIYASRMFNTFNNIFKNNYEENNIEWIGIGFNKNNIINEKKYGTFFKKTNNTILNKKDLSNLNYSVNGTGDILESSTHQWYFNNLKNLFKNESLNLIIADTTSIFDTSNIKLLQKLEFATLCMIAGTSLLKTDCIIRYTLPYKPYLNNESSGFFINCMYVYSLLFKSIKFIKPLNNNNVSYDFYLICTDFKGIEQNTLDKLLLILDNFQENMCFIDKKNIPNKFIEQISYFINGLMNININNMEMTNLLSTCLLNENNIFFKKANCNFYLNDNFIESLKDDQIKQWLKDNNI
jgi:hypothetical protein